jgi:hypothetical protein
MQELEQLAAELDSPEDEMKTQAAHSHKHRPHRRERWLCGCIPAHVRPFWMDHGPLALAMAGFMFLFINILALAVLVTVQNMSERTSLSSSDIMWVLAAVLFVIVSLLSCAHRCWRECARRGVGCACCASEHCLCCV